jgi:hypothetical protein
MVREPAGSFAGTVETGDRTPAQVDDSAGGVDPQASHGVVQDRR